ncbi:MAG: hypothetical protein Kow0040_10500 [Thermogutta sp.]
MQRHYVRPAGNARSARRREAVPSRLLALCLAPFFLAVLFGRQDRSTDARESTATIIHVSVDGNDAWTGRSERPNPDAGDGPVATIGRAVALAAALPANTPRVEIVIQPGEYALDGTVALSGRNKPLPPLVIRSAVPGKVRLSGGRRLTVWQPITDPKVKARLPQEVRDRVRQTSLKDLGITDFGSPGGGGLELFFDDRPMTLARWPNEGFTHIADILGEQPMKIHGIPGDKVGKFVFEGDRPSRWTEEKDPWVHGYWFWDWSDQRHSVASIDPEKRIIEVRPPYHTYGYRKGQWFYGFNLLCELDRPGEWYLDRESGVLYFLPPMEETADVDAVLKSGRPTVSILQTLFEVDNVEDLTLSGLILEHARGTMIAIRDSRRVTVENCLLQNGGGWGVQVRGGEQCAVRWSRLYLLGEGGVSLDGGDRPTLTPSEHEVTDCEISDYGRIYPMYRAGVSIGGVGQRVLHNHIHHAPHQAVGFSGNDHLIAFNEIDHVCLESNDAGAVYSGRDWTMRGTRIEKNYFHDIQGFQNRGCMGVYLDDMFCGTVIADNIFVRVTRAAFIGGGRDNLVENNLFIDCKPAVHVDARAMGWASYHVDTTMTERLRAMPYQNTLWAGRYPDLPPILEQEPAAPRGNVIRHNLCLGGTWESVEAKARPYINVEENLVLGTADDSGLLDPNGQLRWNPQAPVFAKLPGFRIPPFEQIGPREKPAPTDAEPAAAEKSGRPSDPTRWESDIRKFEEQDRLQSPPKDPVLFVGSSSIRLWDTAKSFPEWPTLNRGFGGSQIHEVTHFADRIVLPYRPRLIVFYAGDNDLASGVDPDTVLERFQTFVKKLRDAELRAPIIFVGIKPSVARWRLIDKIREANRKIQEWAENHPEQDVHFLSVEKPMLDDQGFPRGDLLREDGLHLNQRGYEIWNDLLRKKVAEIVGAAK